jgi:transposase-like protein
MLPAGQPRLECPLLPEQQPNPAVARRLAWIPDEQKRRAAAERFANGEALKALAREHQVPGSSHRAATRTAYCLRQEIVEQNPGLWLAATREAIRAARDQSSHSDWAWIACRAHVSGSRVNQLREGAGGEPLDSRR